MIKSEELFTPITGTGFGKPFQVNGDMLSAFLDTPSGNDMGVADAFELHRVLEVDGNGDVVESRAYQVTEDATVLMMGTNNNQRGLVVDGDYAWKKIVVTTPAIGISAHRGPKVAN